jgi:hypothetical protein
MIDGGLRELAGLLAGHVPAIVISELLVSVDAYEAKAGLKQLCDTLSDEEEPLTPAEAALIHRIGLALGVTRASTSMSSSPARDTQRGRRHAPRGLTGKQMRQAAHFPENDDCEYQTSSHRQADRHDRGGRPVSFTSRARGRPGRRHHGRCRAYPHVRAWRPGQRPCPGLRRSRHRGDQRDQPAGHAPARRDGRVSGVRVGEEPGAGFVPARRHRKRALPARPRCTPAWNRCRSSTPSTGNSATCATATA